MDDRDAANWAHQGYRESCKDEKCDKTMCFLGVTHAIKRAVESETRELEIKCSEADKIAEANTRMTEIAADMTREANMWMSETAIAKKAGEWMEAERDQALEQLAAAKAEVERMTGERDEWKSAFDYQCEALKAAVENQNDERTACEKAESERDETREVALADAFWLVGAWIDKCQPNTIEHGALMIVAAELQSAMRAPSQITQMRSERDEITKILDACMAEGATLPERVRNLDEECNKRGVEINDIWNELYGEAATKKGKPELVLAVRALLTDRSQARKERDEQATLHAEDLIRVEQLEKELRIAIILTETARDCGGEDSPCGVPCGFCQACRGRLYEQMKGWRDEARNECDTERVARERDCERKDRALIVARAVIKLADEAPKAFNTEQANVTLKQIHEALSPDRR